MLKKIRNICFCFILMAVASYFILGSLVDYYNPISSTNVLLEEWAPSYVIEEASKYIIENNIDSIYIVGSKAGKFDLSLFEKLNNKKKYQLSVNASLGFLLENNKIDDSFNIGIRMKGSYEGNYNAHYNILINNNPIKSGFLTSKDSIYKFQFKTKNEIKESLLIVNFNNDSYSKTGDRNLNIYQLFDNSIDLKLNIKNIFYDNGLFYKRNRLKFMKTYLSDLGCDTSKVKLIELKESDLGINRTLNLAKGTNEYFKNSNLKNVNLFTTFEHSKRSHLNFQNCLKNKVEVGCIPVKSNNPYSKSIKNRIDQRFSLLLTYAYWWFN